MIVPPQNGRVVHVWPPGPGAIVPEPKGRVWNVCPPGAVVREPLPNGLVMCVCPFGPAVIAPLPSGLVSCDRSAPHLAALALAACRKTLSDAQASLPGCVGRARGLGGRVGQGAKHSGGTRTPGPASLPSGNQNEPLEFI